MFIFAIEFFSNMKFRVKSLCCNTFN